jgi:hypothetical protein
MTSSFETLNTARQAFIENAMGPVFDALNDLDNGQAEGVSLGDINRRVREIHPDKDFSMGIIPTVLDAWEAEGEVACIPVPVSSSENGHAIGRKGWETFRYKIIEPPLSTQIAR